MQLRSTHLESMVEWCEQRGNTSRGAPVPPRCSPCCSPPWITVSVDAMRLSPGVVNLERLAKRNVRGDSWIEINSHHNLASTDVANHRALSRLPSRPQPFRADPTYEGLRRVSPAGSSRGQSARPRRWLRSPALG